VRPAVAGAQAHGRPKLPGGTGADGQAWVLRLLGRWAWGPQAQAAWACVAGGLA